MTCWSTVHSANHCGCPGGSNIPRILNAGDLLTNVDLLGGMVSTNSPTTSRRFVSKNYDWLYHCLTPQQHLKSYGGGDHDHGDDHDESETKMKPITRTQCPTLIHQVARVCYVLHYLETFQKKCAQIVRQVAVPQQTENCLGKGP